MAKFSLDALVNLATASGLTVHIQVAEAVCGSAWKKDPDSGVIGVEKGPLIPLV